MRDGLTASGPKIHHHPIDFVADANAILSGIALYPQLFQVLKTHNVSGLSLTTFFILAATQIIWLLYGIHRRAVPVIVTSLMNGIGAGLLLFLIHLWR